MAKDIRVGIELTDEGSGKKVAANINDVKAKLKETNKEARELKKLLKNLEQSSGRGPEASRRAIEATQTGIVARQRGTAELTGAAGRDFANQAQGLGGLVRLYATYAANVFALGAAFRALNESMDTSNMVKGLDQLGAAGGRNLGGLSKRVAELSGGAISLAEALRAVAQTSSGGLSAKNIERLASVARSASAALGVSMPDAISRLSRGIVKLEPELLDELGIMTRLDPAVDLYARQMGKAASQLTIFERRQAFANAVLAEGEEKFGEIQDIAVNPYDKLLSALKDVIQTGSEFLNTFLAPTVELLAESPTALGAGIAALGALIVRQALPALGQFRAGLASAAVQAAEIAEGKAKDAQLAIDALNDNLTSASENVARVQEEQALRQGAALNKLTELRGAAISQQSQLYKTLQKDVEDVSELEINRIEEQAKRLERLDKGRAREAEQYRVIAQSLREEKVAAEQLFKVQENNQKLTNKVESKGSVFGLTQALAIEAQNNATKKLIISNAAYNGSLIGIRGSWQLLNAEIAKSNIQMGAFSKSVLLVRGGLAILGGTLSTVTAAFGKLTNVLAIIGTITALYSILELFFSDNAKSAAKFTSSLDNVESSLDNVKRTLAKIDKDSTKGTIQGINALAEAFTNLTDTAEEALSAAITKQKDTTSIYDRIVENLLKIPGLDTESKLAESFVTVVEGSLDLLSKSGLKEQAEEVFKDLLDIQILDTKNIELAISRLSKGAQKELIDNLRKQSIELSNSASRLTEFKTASEAATLVYQQFIQTTSNNDPVFRVGAALENLASTMFKIAEQTKLGAKEVNAVILELGKNPEAGLLFGDTFVQGLLNVRNEFKEQELAIIKYEKNIEELNEKIANTPINELFVNSAGFIEEDLEATERNISTLEKLLQDRKKLEERVQSLSIRQAESARNLFLTGMDEAFRKGSELIRVALGQAAEKGAIAISKATLAGLSGEERAKAEASIAKKEIEIRLRAIEINVDLILSQEKLRASIESNTAALALADARASGKSGEQIKQLEQALEVSRVFSEVLNSSSVPNFENASRFTSDEDIAKRVQVRGIGVSQRLAEQEQSKILAQQELQAAAISGQISLRLGQLEDTQKLLDLEAKLTGAINSRVNAVKQLVGINNEDLIIEQNKLELAELANKQASELAGINTAIANAQSEAERRKQEEFKALILSRQETELSTKQIQLTNSLIGARLEMFGRELELAKAINQEILNSESKRLDLNNAEVTAFSQLFNITGEFAAAQLEIIGNQKAQLDFVKQTSDATLDFNQKALEINEKINALDPIADASAIEQLTTELERQEALTQSRIKSSYAILVNQQAILKVNKQATTQQTRYNRLLDSASKITSNLSSSFDDVGSSIGGLVEAFANLTVVSDQGVKAIDKILEKQKSLSKGSDEYKENQKQLSIQLDQNARNQISGYGQIAGAAKNLFEEQTTGYQALLAAERLFHVAHLGMTLARMAMDTAATISSVTNSGTRMAADVAEAEVSGVKSILNAFEDIPFPFNIAAGAAMGAIVAGLLSSIGGKAPGGINASAGFTAEDVQSTQGTGSIYSNGKLVDRSGGILGASTEKVEDLINALTLIEDNTSVTSSYGRQTIDTLKQIEINTQNLAGAVLGTTNIGKLTSGFGTVEKVSAPKTTGLLSLFIPSTSKSTEIIDKGIEVIGQFRDILSETAQFLEFETIKTTKVKSGFFGIGAKTKVKISTQTKELGQEASEVIVKLFTELADSAVVASKLVFGQATDNIQTVLEDFVVNFKVSGFGLSSSEFSEAILSESNVILNQILEKAFPQLDEFRKKGEGFSGTLLRLATTIDVVGEKFRRFGTSTEAISGDAQGSVLRFTTSLVDAFGGLDVFTEKVDYLSDNFLTDAEKLRANTNEFNRSIRILGDQGILTSDQVKTLIDGLGNLRLEYRQIIASQDLMTESGREAANILATLAPAVVEITEELEDLAYSLTNIQSSFRDTISSILEQAALGTLDPETLGFEIASSIREGFLSALSATFVSEITDSIVNELITPVVTGTVKLVNINSAIITASIDKTVEDITNKIKILSRVLSDASFRQALNNLSTSISEIVTSINDNAKSLDIGIDSLRITDLLQEISDLAKDIESRRLDDIIDAENERLDILKEQESALKSSIDRFKEFSQSLKDFKQSLLTGGLSPLTPIEQLSTSREELNRLYQIATSAVSTEEDRIAALERVQQASTTFLEASRLVFSSGPQFTKDFEFVQTILDSLINTTGIKASIDELQLEAIKVQISISEGILEATRDAKNSLGDSANTLTEMKEKLADLTALLEKEFDRGGDQLSDSFSLLDKNFDGLLTIDELKSSGIASDDTLDALIDSIDLNGDSQISRLESLKGSSEGTYFTLQSIVPILSAINNGIISVSQGVSQINLIQDANVGSGGSPVTGTINSGSLNTSGSSSSLGFSNGSIVQTNADIFNNTVRGVNSLSVSVGEAKSAILTYVSLIESGSKTARDLFNLFKDWGASSSIVGQILGISSSEVVNWLRSRDPSIPSFDQGINRVPYDMFAKIHEGERIFPKADNDKLMQIIENKQSSNNLLIAELQKLNAKIEELKEVIKIGDSLNVDATSNSTKELEEALTKINKLNNQFQSLKDRSKPR